MDPSPAKAQEIKQWTVNYWDALHPYSAGGVYVNFMMNEGQERIKATYRDNYQRLSQIKKKYDPNLSSRIRRLLLIHPRFPAPCTKL